MHGELLKARCTRCGTVMPWQGDLDGATPCPSCQEAPALRPHVVWFGEMPFGVAEVATALASSDLFVAIGTSGSVYPAAGFVLQAQAAGLRTCELNLEPSDNAGEFDERRYGMASHIVPAWVDSVLLRR